MAVNVVLKSVFDDKGIRAAQSQFASIGKSIGVSMAAVGAVVAVAGAATFKFGSDAIKAAEGVRQANDRLAQINTSMALFGSETTAVTDRLIKFAEANELTVAVDAEVIKATQAKLLTFKALGETADEAGGAFDRATLAALDLAAAGFGSAETNAIQLGKALQDPIKGLSALRRAGVTFNEQEKENIKTLVESGQTLKAQEAILKAIESQVGGTAAATATGTQKMKLAFENVYETVGAALMPAFDDLSEIVVQDLAPALSDVAEEIGPILVEAMKVIAGVLKDATDESTPLGKSVKNLGEQFGILFDALAGGKSDVEGTTDTLSGLADIVSFLVTTMASFVAFLQTLGPAIDALLKGDVEKFWDWLNSDPIEFLNNQQAAEDALKQTGEEFRNTADSARRLNNISLDKLRGQLGDVTIDGKKLADQQRELYYAMRGEKPPKTTTTTTTTNTNTGGKTQKEIREEQIKAAREAFEKVQKLVKATQQKIIDAQSSYDKAVSKANSDYLRNVSKLREDYAAKLEDIVLSSQNRLRDAFRSAVSGSLSDMFGTDAEKGVATLVENLRKRVIASRQLIENSSQLASLGFTQTFIEQVASAGLETGNELASAILKSTPQTQAELKSLFLTLEDTSETGMDALAKTIFEKQGLATRELRNLYDKAGEDLNRALAEQQKLLAETLEAAAVQLRDKLREIKDDFEEDIGELKGAYGGLKSAIDAVNGSLDTMIGKSQTAVNGAVAAAAKAAGVTTSPAPETGKAATPNSDLGGGFRTFGDPETVNRMLALQAAGEALGMYNQGFVDMVLKTQRSFRRGTEEKTVGGLISPEFVKQLLSEGFTEIAAPKVNPDKLALALALAEQIYGADIGGISTPGQVGGNTFNISVNAGMGTDPISVGAQIVDAIKRYERSSGQVFASV